MAKKKEVQLEVEVKEESKVCAHCGGHLSNESFVEKDGKRFCSLGCSNS